MKVRIFSEDHPQGLEADWSAIPREGETVAFHHRGGTSDLTVTGVRWHVETDGTPIDVEIHLAD